MATEIERKYLVRGDAWRDEAADSRRFKQAYLSRLDHVSIRIRIIDDVTAKLTIKSGRRGLSREEFEYEVPVNDGLEMLALRKGAIVEKTRYRVIRGDLTWEIDVFAGENSGLVVAEVELEGEDQAISLPEWIGEEVTGDPKYYNASLSVTPFNLWSAPDQRSESPLGNSNETMPKTALHE